MSVKKIVLELDLEAPLTDENGEVVDLADREDFWGNPAVQSAFKEMAAAEDRRLKAEGLG